MSSGVCTEQVWSKYGAGTEQVPTWQCKQNEKNQNKKKGQLPHWFRKER